MRSIPNPPERLPSDLDDKAQEIADNKRPFRWKFGGGQLIIPAVVAIIGLWWGIPQNSERELRELLGLLGMMTAVSLIALLPVWVVTNGVRWCVYLWRYAKDGSLFAVAYLKQRSLNKDLSNKQQDLSDTARTLANNRDQLAEVLLQTYLKQKANKKELPGE